MVLQGPAALAAAFFSDERRRTVVNAFVDFEFFVHLNEDRGDRTRRDRLAYRLPDTAENPRR